MISHLLLKHRIIPIAMIETSLDLIDFFTSSIQPNDGLGIIIDVIIDYV